MWDTEGSVGFSRCPCDVASIAIWLNLEVFETIALDIPMYAVEVAVEAFVYHLAPDSEPMALENGKDFRNAWSQILKCVLGICAGYVDLDQT